VKQKADYRKRKAEGARLLLFLITGGGAPDGVDHGKTAHAVKLNCIRGQVNCALILAARHDVKTAVGKV